MTDEIITELQKARLLVFLRRLGAYAVSEDDHDQLMLIGLAVGLRLAMQQPRVAAAMLVELAPPPFEDVLEWVAEGSTRPDPNLPIN